MKFSKRNKHLKKLSKKKLKKLSSSKSNVSSDNQSDNSSEYDSDLQLPSSKRAKLNESNIQHEPNETNSQYEEFADFNETI
jgi:hypothetical protein